MVFWDYWLLDEVKRGKRENELKLFYKHHTQNHMYTDLFIHVSYWQLSYTDSCTWKGKRYNRREPTNVQSKNNSYKPTI